MHYTHNILVGAARVGDHVRYGTAAGQAGRYRALARAADRGLTWRAPFSPGQRAGTVSASADASPSTEPPSQSKIAPVTYLALSLHRKTAISAISRLRP